MRPDTYSGLGVLDSCPSRYKRCHSFGAEPSTWNEIGEGVKGVFFRSLKKCSISLREAAGRAGSVYHTNGTAEARNKQCSRSLRLNGLRGVHLGCVVVDDINLTAVASRLIRETPKTLLFSMPHLPKGKKKDGRSHDLSLFFLRSFLHAERLMRPTVVEPTILPTEAVVRRFPYPFNFFPPLFSFSRQSSSLSGADVGAPKAETVRFSQSPF